MLQKHAGAGSCVFNVEAVYGAIGIMMDTIIVLIIHVDFFPIRFLKG